MTEYLNYKNVLLELLAYATRIQHKIHIFRPKHEYAKKCIRNDIPNLVNNTPHNIIEKIYTHSLQGFSRYVKKTAATIISG